MKSPCNSHGSKKYFVFNKGFQQKFNEWKYKISGVPIKNQRIKLSKNEIIGAKWSTKNLVDQSKWQTSSFFLTKKVWPHVCVQRY